MTRDEFFKLVLKHMFYEFAKNPSDISWDSTFNAITIRIKTKGHDTFVRIYEEHYIIFSSSTKGPFQSNGLNIDEFKLKYSHITDEVPF